MRSWWYYLPVLAGLLLPWSGLVPLLANRANLRDPRRRFLLAWAAFGLVLFSASVNKLAGYVLPLVPAIAALFAIQLDESKRPRVWLAACALLLVVFPIAVPAAAEAVAFNLSNATMPPFHWTWLLPVAVAGAVWVLDGQERKIAAVLAIGLGAGAGLFFLKLRTAPEIDRIYSARSLWKEIQPTAPAVCVDNINRGWRYGLNYYSVTPLPECSAARRPLRVVQAPGQPPELVRGVSGRLTADRPLVYAHFSTKEFATKP